MSRRARARHMAVAIKRGDAYSYSLGDGDEAQDPEHQSGGPLPARRQPSGALSNCGLVSAVQQSPARSLTGAEV